MAIARRGRSMRIQTKPGGNPARDCHPRIVGNRGECTLDNRVIVQGLDTQVDFANHHSRTIKDGDE